MKIRLSAPAELLDFVYMYMYSRWMRLFIMMAAQALGGGAKPAAPAVVLRLLRLLAAAPVLTAAADFVENTCIITMLLCPSTIFTLASWGSVANVAKWAGAAASIAGLAAAAVVMLMTRWVAWHPKHPPPTHAATIKTD